MDSQSAILQQQPSVSAPELLELLLELNQSPTSPGNL